VCEVHTTRIGCDSVQAAWPVFVNLNSRLWVTPAAAVYVLLCCDGVSTVIFAPSQMMS
jgi:hypothetical protein